MGCMWDSVRSIWYCNKSNYCYTDGPLSQYLYLIELNNVRFPFDNSKVKKFGARWNPDIRKFWVFLQNPYFLDGSLDRFHPSRNGQYFFYFLVTIYFLRFDFVCSVGRLQYGNQIVPNPPPNAELPLPLAIAPRLFLPPPALPPPAPCKIKCSFYMNGSCRNGSACKYLH